jgi:hypothetical protein
MIKSFDFYTKASKLIEAKNPNEKQTIRIGTFAGTVHLDLTFNSKAEELYYDSATKTSVQLLADNSADSYIRYGKIFGSFSESLKGHLIDYHCKVEGIDMKTETIQDFECEIGKQLTINQTQNEKQY